MHQIHKLIKVNKLGLFILLSAFTMVSCSNSNKQQADESQEVSIIEEATIAPQSAEISLDWAGVYKGVMPTEDGEGAEVVLELKYDLTYIAQYTFLSKPEGENILINEGPFTWNDDGNSISLQAEDKPTQYKVTENLLYRLDDDGKVVTGRMADVNVLQKEM